MPSGVYTRPDFYLKKYDIYLNPKGFIWPGKKDKYDLVDKEYPGKVIFLIGGDYLEQFTRFYISKIREIK